MATKVNSSMIVDALARKHSSDLFITECKTGPSQYVGCPRFDAWVMKRSWTNSLIIGYEIKVDRQDFLADTKWRNYLPYCNEFYFVCPSKIINKDEVSDDAGLMYISSTGTRVYTKKKAPYRELQIPDELYHYILMCRTTTNKYERPVDVVPSNKEAFWRKWLERKKDKLDLGYQVGKKLRTLIKEKIEDVELKNRRLKEQIECFTSIQEMLKELGLDPSSHWIESNFRRKITELQKVVPHELSFRLDSLSDSLQQFKKELVKIEAEENDSRTSCRVD